MDVVQKNSILEDLSSFPTVEKFDLEKPYKGPTQRKSGEVVMPILKKSKGKIH